MKTIRPVARNGQIELLIQHGNETLSIPLPGTDLGCLLIEIGQAVATLPRDQNEPLAGKRLTYASRPDFEVELSPNGDVVVFFDPQPLPILEFHFDHAATKKLSEDLLNALRTPKFPNTRQ